MRCKYNRQQSMSSPAVVIGGVAFEHPIMNASGCWVSTYDQMCDLHENSVLSGVVCKTCTIDQRIGNPKPNYYCDPSNSLYFNCKGLPNYGYEYYRLTHQRFINREDLGGGAKPFILSIAYTDTATMTAILRDYDDSIPRTCLVEINMSCPNIHSRIPGYHKSDMVVMLANIREMRLKHVRIGLKLPPYFEIQFMHKVVEIFNYYCDIISFLVLSNSIPNGVTIDDAGVAGELLSRPFVGMSGNQINKHLSLGNIMVMRPRLNSEICIIGCGGIERAEDVKLYLDHGACAVQIASRFYDEPGDKLCKDRIKFLLENYRKLVEHL